MLMVALSRSGRCSGWAQLDPAATTTASYRPAISSWAVTNATAAPDLTLTMEAAPTAGGRSGDGGATGGERNDSAG